MAKQESVCTGWSKRRRMSSFSHFFAKGGNVMDEEKYYNWFMIMCSWDWDADADALKRFQWVYRYLNVYNHKEEWEKVVANPDDPRNAMDFESLKGLNLIGQRKFVIIGRTTSNKVLQEISSNITLETAIRVDVFPAIYAHAFAKINIGRLEGITEQEIKSI